MANFFSDIVGGYLGQGPGTDTISGYEGLSTIGKRSADLMRGYLSEESAGPGSTNLQRGRAVFSPDYQAIPEADIEKRVGRVRGAYQEQFNPFLQGLQQGIDRDLSRSGLLTSTRSSALRGQTLGQLAVQSAMPTAELQNALEEQNRQEIWNRRMGLLGMGRSDTTPATIEMPKSMSLERAYGSYLGKGVGAVVNAATLGTANYSGGIQNPGNPGNVGNTNFSASRAPRDIYDLG